MDCSRREQAVFLPNHGVQHHCRENPPQGCLEQQDAIVSMPHNALALRLFSTHSPMTCRSQSTAISFVRGLLRLAWFFPLAMLYPITSEALERRDRSSGTEAAGMWDEDRGPPASRNRRQAGRKRSGVEPEPKRFAVGGRQCPNLAQGGAAATISSAEVVSALKRTQKATGEARDISRYLVVGQLSRDSAWIYVQTAA